MAGPQEEVSDKPFDPTPQKLQKAREKGEIAKSADLSVAAAYLGLLVVLAGFGASTVIGFGTGLMVLIDQAPELSDLVFNEPHRAVFSGIFGSMIGNVAPWFAVPAIAVLLSILGQRAFVVAPTKIQPKLSRISLISNAKNKFGRSGLFEFAKSFAKLTLYAVCLGFFLNGRLEDMIATLASDERAVVAYLARLGLEFLFLVAIIAGGIGVVDALWQHAEHIRKNRMSRKEITDETKESEGDPHMKQERRQRGQEIAMSQMMADVPTADVIIVNPTHYAVALKWSRAPGSAPTCVAKGVDEIAASIRKVAMEHAVPIHSDPPTARALHATVEIGHDILEEHYAPVAAAIRFAESMREKAKRSVT
ncbi:MAG: flagellar type III secretion system protein FlhB [Rhodobacteraceae bacterium]|nr:flagellar type III secretion system protein FlhB [Paracoccaceae bacterium]